MRIRSSALPLSSSARRRSGLAQVLVRASGRCFCVLTVLPGEVGRGLATELPRGPAAGLSSWFVLTVWEHSAQNAARYSPLQALA